MFDFKGVITALITPFTKNDKIDFTSLETLILKQINANVDAILIGGSTGEGSSIDSLEYSELISCVVVASARQIPIIGAISASSTSDALRRANALSGSGLSGIMCTAPHYIKPGQDGILRHFTILNNEIDVPMMIYTNPTRTGCDISDDAISNLSKLDNILAIKDSSSDYEKPLRLSHKVDKNFNFLAGDDVKFLSYTANGGNGCVSVIANVFPKISRKIYSLLKKSDFLEALILQQKLTIITNFINLVPNPVGIKHLASKMCLCSSRVRLPLIKWELDTPDHIDKILDELILMEEDY